MRQAWRRHRLDDIGGGWAWGRPEKTGPEGADDAATPSFDAFAEAVCPALTSACKARNLAPPRLRIEPGRALSASTGITIGRVGAVKTWPEYGKTWVNVDCSTNHVIRIINAHWYHHIVCVNKANVPATETVTVVGPLCSLDHLGEGRKLPPLVRGDMVALLDTGSYAESTSANYNAECRPATVLVCGEEADVSTVRERRGDVVGRYQVPPRLLAGSFAAG